MKNKTYEEFVEKFKPKKQQTIAIRRLLFMMLLQIGLQVSTGLIGTISFVLFIRVVIMKTTAIAKILSL